MVLNAPADKPGFSRAILIVDDVPHGAPASGTRVRLLARPFTAEGLVAEVRRCLEPESGE